MSPWSWEPAILSLGFSLCYMEPCHILLTYLDHKWTGDFLFLRTVAVGYVGDFGCEWNQPWLEMKKFIRTTSINSIWGPRLHTLFTDPFSHDGFLSDLPTYMVFSGSILRGRWGVGSDDHFRMVSCTQQVQKAIEFEDHCSLWSACVACSFWMQSPRDQTFHDSL